MPDPCAEEIVGLHKFFEEWFAGRLEATPANFERCRAALAPSFTIINPDGERSACADLLENLQAAHGRAGDTYLHIRIADVTTRALGDGLHMATYQEWHDSDGFVTARWSTAIFQDAPEAPNGLQWLHVQETWIATDEDRDD